MFIGQLVPCQVDCVALYLLLKVGGREERWFLAPLYSFIACFVDIAFCSVGM